jgi:hypothetical protein
LNKEYRKCSNSGSSSSSSRRMGLVQLRPQKPLHQPLPPLLPPLVGA